MEQSTTRSWSDILLTGVGAIVDSQRQQNYESQDPTYNTAGGRAGTSQMTLAAAASNPIVLIVGGIALVALLLVVLKR
jgi:hypothetical protein